MSFEKKAYNKIKRGFMTTFNPNRGLIEYKENKIETDLTFLTEQGKVFIASQRWEMPGGSTEYIEIRVPSEISMRIYSEFFSVSGGLFFIDLLRAPDFTPGTIEFQHSCLNCVIGIQPAVRLFRGAESIDNAVFIEYNQAGGGGRQASGTAEVFGTYRITNGVTVPLFIRIENRDNQDRFVSLGVIWSEKQ